MARKLDILAEFKEKGVDNVINSAKGMLNTLQAIEEVKEWIQLAQNWTKEWAENMIELGQASEQVKSYLGWVEKLTSTSSSMGDTVFTELNKALKIVNEEYSKLVDNMKPETLKILVRDGLIIVTNSMLLLTEATMAFAVSLGWAQEKFYQFADFSAGAGITIVDAVANQMHMALALIRGGVEGHKKAVRDIAKLDKETQISIAQTRKIIAERSKDSASSMKNLLEVMGKVKGMMASITAQVEDPNFLKLPDPERVYTQKEREDAAKAKYETDKYWENKLIEVQLKEKKRAQAQAKATADAAVAYTKLIEDEKLRRTNATHTNVMRIEKEYEAEQKKRRDKEKSFHQQQLDEIMGIGSALKNEVVGRLEDAIISGKRLSDVFADFNLGKFLLAKTITALSNIAGNALSGGLYGLLGFGFTGGPVRKMASGGPVNGQDSVLALLDPREYVIPGNIVEAIKNDRKITPTPTRQHNGLSITIAAQPVDNPLYWDSIVTKHLVPAMGRRGLI